MTNRAIFASGCFWGTEHFMQRAQGVLTTRVGFSGGHVKNPAYREVCRGTTGHAEVVEVTWDPTQTDYETLARLFLKRTIRLKSIVRVPMSVPSTDPPSTTWMSISVRLPKN